MFKIRLHEYHAAVTHFTKHLSGRTHSKQCKQVEITLTPKNKVERVENSAKKSAMIGGIGAEIQGGRDASSISGRRYTFNRTLMNTGLKDNP